MQEFNLSQNQSLRQEQILAPTQIQSLELLMAPMMELQARLDTELSINPVLELEGNDNINESPDAVETPIESEEVTGTAEAENLEDEEFASLVHLTDEWHNSLPVGNSTRYKADEEKYQYFLDSIVDVPSIQNALLDQLTFLNLSKEEKDNVELIIGSIDNQGYFTTPLEDLAVIAGTDLEGMSKALKSVQGFEPVAIGARNLQESLLIQLDKQGKSKSKAAVLVRKYLDELAVNHIPQIAENMKLTISELQVIIDEVRKLKPFPCFGLNSFTSRTLYVLAELEIVKKDGVYIVNMITTHQPKLRISEYYMRLLENKNTASEAKEYIKQKVLQGNNIIRSLEQRQDTILKIAEVIADTQFEFLENGIEFLKPLTMKQVADKIDMHETTVSRAVSQKYVQTPQGLLELKFFFTGGYQSDSGDLLSSRSVIEKIKEIIGEEDNLKPYSDDAIAENLKNQGIPVARRTVAKYREEVGIPSSRLRRQYK